MVQNKLFRLITKHWVLISILLIAAYFRLYQIGDYMEFLGDQGRDAVIAREFIVNHNLFFIGPQTSVGNMYLGPYYYYLIVVPGLILFNLNPIGPSVIVALLGILTCFLIYRTSLKWFNSKTALIASFAYAISPVAIKYSNFSWNPNIMPLFSLLFFYFLSQKKYIFASLSFIVCINSHFLSLLLLPVGIIFWIYHFQTSPASRHQQISQSVVAIIIFVVSLTPQILFDIKHHGQNINALVSFFTKRESTLSLKPYKAIPYMVPLFNQLNTRLISGKNIIIGYITSIVFALALSYSLFSKKNREAFFLTAWLIIGLTGLALYKQHIYDHYFGFLFPVVFILYAYSISNLNRYLTFIFICLLVFTSLLENPFRWTAPKQLDSTKKIVELIINDSQGQAFNFALLAKMNYDPGYRYFFSTDNANVKLINSQITDTLYVVCEPFQLDCNPINNPFWDIAAFGWAKIDNEWNYHDIKIFKLSHTTQISK